MNYMIEPDNREPKDLRDARKIRDYQHKHVKIEGTLDRILADHASKCDQCTTPKGDCAYATEFRRHANKRLDDLNEEVRELELKYGIITP